MAWSMSPFKVALSCGSWMRGDLGHISQSLCASVSPSVKGEHDGTYLLRVAVTLRRTEFGAQKVPPKLPRLLLSWCVCVGFH